MRNVKFLRGELRKLRELRQAAEIMQDRPALDDLTEKIAVVSRELQAGLLKEAGYASKEDVSQGKPKGVSEGKPR